MLTLDDAMIDETVDGSGIVLSFHVKILWWTACMLLATALFSAYRTHFSIDDAWITYRYAENLADGAGFVFNPGERVLGTSTPLYTMILAFTHWIGLSVPSVSQIIGFLSMLGILAGTYLLMRRIHSEVAGLLAVSLLIPIAFFHRVATYGMETPLYTLCIVFAFHAYSAHRYHLATVLSASALLFRLDGAAVAAALMISYWLTRRRLPWKLILLFVSLTAPWFIFSYVYFDAILPHSFLAKRGHSDSPFQPWIFEWLSSIWISLFAIIGVGVSLMNSALRSKSLPIVIWMIIYILAYSLSSLFGHEWYRTPLTVPLAGFAAVGVLSIADELRRLGLKQVWTITVLMLFLFRANVSLLTGLYRLGAGTWDWRDHLENGRYEAAVWMNANLPEDAVIVTGGIGQVGYVTRRTILDASGLISPQVVVDGLPPAWPRYLPYIIENDEPEYVFIATKDVPSYMKNKYSITRKWQTGYYAGPFVLLERKTAPGSPEMPPREY
jgi:hypothetical protein